MTATKSSESTSYKGATSTTQPPPAAPTEPSRAPFPLARWLLVIVAGLGVYLLGAPAGVTDKAWRLFAIFVATIVGSIARPMAAGAVVLAGVCALALTNAMTPTEALRGYADPIVWLVLCAFFLSRGISKTGLGR